MPTVSTRWDIKSLIEYYANIQVVSSATVRGVLEYHSNCPWCGGTDRFVTRPETGQYTCSTRASGCGRHGDAIDFLLEYARMERRDAYEELAMEWVSFSDEKSSVRAQDDAESAPCKGWQSMACTVIEWAEKALWSPAGREMLDYLLRRGLREEIIKKHRLGYMPLEKDGRWFSASFEQWGLDPEQLTPAQKAKGCVRVPSGILIPWFEGQSVWKLAVKRPGQSPDYGQVLGSKEGLYNVSALQFDEPCMMVEGELDCLSVEQEAGDLINVVATGSTTRGRLSRWITELCNASFVLQSFDEDEPDAQGNRAGDEGATYWLQALKHSIRWSPGVCKDPNDLLKAQIIGTSVCSVREWVEAGLDAARVEFHQHQSPLQGAEQIESTSYQRHIDTQSEFERLCFSERVETPHGPGQIWDMGQLREHIERGLVRVTLNHLKGKPGGATELFLPHELEPVLEVLSL